MDLSILEARTVSDSVRRRKQIPEPSSLLSVFLFTWRETSCHRFLPRLLTVLLFLSGYQKSARACNMSSIRASLDCAMSICRQIHHVQGIWGGLVSSLEPRREGRQRKESINETADPVVAFSRPPPPPGFVGSLVALSLWEYWSRKDRNDD